MTFNDVLEIKNGKNQRAVESPDGKYPIYGSGGLMGYANDYICNADTVIIGRKGSINNPIFVEEPFWNVDTAFGLQAKQDVLLPRYLFYFCRYFDFERLNKTVTIPSLTKSDLEIDVKVKCLEEGVTQAQLVQLAGTSPSYVSRLINKKEGIINKVFVDMLDKLGYDIQLVYVKKKGATEE